MPALQAYACNYDFLVLEFAGITEACTMPIRTDYYLYPATFEKLLLAELSCELPASQHKILQPGVIETCVHDSDLERPARLAFVSQALPNAMVQECQSISDWAEFLFQKISAERLDSHWHFHCFDLDFTTKLKQPRRVQLIKEKILEVLQRRLRSARRSLAAESAPTSGPLLQLALLSPSKALCSFLPASAVQQFLYCLHPFCAGAINLADDKFPPSRAYRKLLEAELLVGARILAGQSCVDLGASPGGWSAVVLSRQAKLIAVDRSPLRADLMKNPLLEFVRGDGFKFTPKAPVDWLLCDIIAYPERNLELLATWLEKKLCNAFVVTLKFKGTPDLKVITNAKDLLSTHCKRFIVRHLQSNKNEVALVGTNALKALE